MTVSIKNNLQLGLQFFCAALFIVFFAVYVVTSTVPVIENELAVTAETEQNILWGEGSQEEIEEQLNKLNVRRTILQEKTTVYMLSVGVILALLLAGTVFMFLTKLRITSFLTALCFLLLIGSSYQYQFLMSSSWLIHMCMAIGAGLIVFLAVRNHPAIPFWCYYSLAFVIWAGLLINLLFGKAANNAALWISVGGISVQIGEAVKFLLILLGAYSYLNTSRSAVFCTTSIFSCVTLVLLHDIGNAAIIFGIFAFVTYYIFDNKLFSVSVIALAAVTLILLICFFSDEARSRFLNCGYAMRRDTAPEIIDALRQQTSLLKELLYGGFRGLGIENVSRISGIYSYDSDMAIAGVQAVFGVPALAAVILSYYLIVVQARWNSSVHPCSYLILVQTAMLITVQVLLNYGGSIDFLPFTGVVAPFISRGGSAMISFGCIMGACAAALCPAVRSGKHAAANPEEKEG
ncbi:MAG: FtsW/RodA/SpoVE family cell cycle protein [Clostridia bacterium]|nr:FtsW/RodA/SpoVE family cell cycle protein [Clostridia bacterium]